VVEELPNMFSHEDVTGVDSPERYSEEQEMMYSLSVHALTGDTASVPSVIKLHAYIAEHEVLILVNSGSSTSFINQTLAEQIQGIQKLPKLYSVKVVDGSKHRCDRFIPNCRWFSQGNSFTTDLKILPLGSFDVILGMDWLEQHNPNIDWIKKTLHFTGWGGRQKYPSARDPSHLISVFRDFGH
jgi:hypothetical protein